MARKTQSAAAETLDEIQSSADRFADWIRENLGLVAGGIGLLLAAAGLISFLASARSQTEEAASAALFKARSDYLTAMGGGPGSFEVPTLANPAAAAQIRGDFEAALEEIAREYSGTTVEFVSRLEAGLLRHQGGDAEGALAIYSELADAGDQEDALRGLAIQRAAQVLEDLERWDEAASRHEAASELSGYPLRDWALADAARTHAAAGETRRAVELYDQLELRAPALQLPDAQRAQAQELRALLDRG